MKNLIIKSKSTPIRVSHRAFPTTSFPSVLARANRRGLCMSDNNTQIPANWRETLSEAIGMKNLIVYIVVLFVFTGVKAQTLVTPAPAQKKAILLVGATAHLGNGTVIQNAQIGFENGKLTVVADTNTDIDQAKYEVINVSGKEIYPGFILPLTNLGLREVFSVKATDDNSEVGNTNPSVRSIIAYNTDSEIIPTLKFNGILTAQITPYGSLINGTTSIVQLDAWNWEDAILVEDDGLCIIWPSRQVQKFDFETFSMKSEPNKNYTSQFQTINDLFTQSLAYGKSTEREENLKLASIQGLFDGTKRLFIFADSEKGIVESVKFAQKKGIKRIVINGGSYSHLVADFLKNNNIPVILDNVHGLPQRPGDDIDLPYKSARILHDAGVLVGLGYFGYMGTMSSRNLPFYAGTTAAHGLSKEDALKLITSNTAKILGIDDKVGTLEVGKNATLFVSEGDALDMRTNQLIYAFIDGRKIQLKATQQVLFEKYEKKYAGE